MKTKLERVADKAGQEPRQRFDNLAHILGEYFLYETWRKLNRSAASGVDRQTALDYEEKLDERVIDLLDRVKSGRYKAPPVRRIYVEKPGKPGALCPIGIPTTEDKLLQRAVSRILGAIYEKEFLDFSYGFRPGRSQHMALGALGKAIWAGKTSYVFEADIKGYFDHINHEWVRKDARFKGQRSNYQASSNQVAESRSHGKWGSGIKSNWNSARGFDKPADIQHISALCLRPVV